MSEVKMTHKHKPAAMYECGMRSGKMGESHRHHQKEHHKESMLEERREHSKKKGY